MSEQLTGAPIPRASREEYLPHSGPLLEPLREHSLRVVDNATLPEAYERGRLVIPTESPAQLVEQPKAPKGKKGLLIGVGAGAAGLAIAAGAVFGVGSANEAPKTGPVATAAAGPSDGPTFAATPEATADGHEVTPVTTEAYAIPGDLTPGAAGRVVVERLSDWAMAGATAEMIDGHNADLSSDYTQSIAAQNARAIADALFIPGWEENDQLRNYVQFEQDNNAGALEIWYLTSESGLPQDREPYMQSISVDAVTVESSTGDTSHLQVDATEHDNADQNSVDERISRTAWQKIDGNKIRGAVTLQRVGGDWKVSAIEWVSRQ